MSATTIDREPQRQGGVTWTDQLVGRMTALYYQGLSSLMIAQALALPSRNTVSGKLDRLIRAGVIKKRANGTQSLLQSLALFWTVDRIAIFDEMYFAGALDADIANVLGCEEHTVASKRKKFKLPQNKPRVEQPAEPAPETVVTVSPNILAVEIASIAQRDPGDPSRGIAMVELQHGECRWPTGTVPATMTFCGQSALPGKAYCDHHFARAHRKPSEEQGTEPRSNAG